MGVIHKTNVHDKLRAVLEGRSSGDAAVEDVVRAVTRMQEQDSVQKSPEHLQTRRTITTTRKRPAEGLPPRSSTHKKSKTTAEDGQLKGGDGTEETPLEFYDDAEDEDKVVAKKPVEAKQETSSMAQVVAKMWDGIKVKKDQL